MSLSDAFVNKETGWTAIPYPVQGRTVYVSWSVGNDSYDGFYPLPQGGTRGPKKTVRAAVDMIDGHTYGNPTGIRGSGPASGPNSRGGWQILFKRGDTWTLGVDASGTATGGGAATITKAGAGWTGNQFAGRDMHIKSGTGAGQTRRVASNTADTITVATAWTIQPDATSVFQVYEAAAWPNAALVGSAGAYSYIPSGPSATQPTVIGAYDPSDDNTVARPRFELCGPNHQFVYNWADGNGGRDYRNIWIIDLDIESVNSDGRSGGWLVGGQPSFFASAAISFMTNPAGAPPPGGTNNSGVIEGVRIEGCKITGYKNGIVVDGSLPATMDPLPHTVAIRRNVIVGSTMVTHGLHNASVNTSLDHSAPRSNWGTVFTGAAGIYAQKMFTSVIEENFFIDCGFTGAVIDSGTISAVASSGAGVRFTNDLISDAGKSWAVNELAGRAIRITSGPASGSVAGIISNTATQVTVWKGEGEDGVVTSSFDYPGVPVPTNTYEILENSESIRMHATYISSGGNPAGSLFRRNVTARGSNTECRAGGYIQENLIVGATGGLLVLQYQGLTSSNFASVEANVVEGASRLALIWHGRSGLDLGGDNTIIGPIWCDNNLVINSTFSGLSPTSYLGGIKVYSGTPYGFVLTNNVVSNFHQPLNIQSFSGFNSSAITYDRVVDNIFDAETGDVAAVLAPQNRAGAYFSGNQYYSSLADGSRFSAGGSTVTNAVFNTYTGETMTFANPVFTAARSITNYNSNIGGPGTLADMVTKWKTMRKGVWTQAYECIQAINYLRDGYDMNLLDTDAAWSTVTSVTSAHGYSGKTSNVSKAFAKLKALAAKPSKPS